MPCMGPSRTPPEKVAQITNDVLVFLLDRYKIFGPDKHTIPNLKRIWEDNVKDLTKAIDELCWTDNCIGF